MKRLALLLPLLALAAVFGCAKRAAPATNENAAFMGDVVLFPNEGSPIWKFQSFHHDAENNVSTDVFPVEPASPPFDLIGTWCRTTADFLLRIRIAGEGIQPIAELWQSANEHNPNLGQFG